MSFKYFKNKLSIVHEGKNLDLNFLVKGKSDPFYVYDILGMKKRLELFKNSFNLKKLSVHYALKANANLSVLKAFSSQGIGVDVVSGGELQRALDASFKGENVVFSGIGKTKAELELAIKLNIKQVNVESPAELLRIASIASRMNRKVRVAFRVNPDVNPETHPYIRTGFRDNKFGMDQSFFPELRNILKKHSKVLEFVGLSMHIGSQIQEITPFLEAIEKTLILYKSLKREGWNLRTFDIGGGLGLSYKIFGNLEDDEIRIKEYGKRVSDLFSNFEDEVLCEPGRILVARFGTLFGEVQYIKQTPYKNFIILNTGMHHLLRPSLYQAFHNILPLEKKECNHLYDIVGPICESSDVLGVSRSLPEVKSGDWLSIMDTGAYGYTMASGYNFHEFPEEKIIKEDEFI